MVKSHQTDKKKIKRMHSLKAVFSEVIGTGLCLPTSFLGCVVDPEAAHEFLLPFGSMCFGRFYWKPSVLGAGSVTVRKCWSREILAWSVEEGEVWGTFLRENVQN